MGKGIPGGAAGAISFSKRLLQGVFGHRVSLAELGGVGAAEFLAAVKGVHFIMQDIVTQKLLGIAGTGQVEPEESAFDEYDIEYGYEEEGGEEGNPWEACGGLLDRAIKIAVRLLRNPYSQCMGEDIMQFLDYLKFELDTANEGQ